MGTFRGRCGGELPESAGRRPSAVAHGPTAPAVPIQDIPQEWVGGEDAGVSLGPVADDVFEEQTLGDPVAPNHRYRRWKDRASLVVDALAEHFATDIPIPDTGAVETDLQAIARALAQSMTGPVGRAVQTAIFSDAGRLPEIAEARRRVFADRFRRAEPVVARAIERGELPAGTDAVELFKTLAAPIYFRLLVSADPVEEGTADQAVRITLAAARAGALTQGSAVADKATEADAGQA